jgi:hypothetical protein
LPEKLEKAFVDIFFQSYQKPPKSMILDLDVTAELAKELLEIL